MPKFKESVQGMPLACEIMLDGYLHQSLKDQNEFRRKNFDVVGLITGEEGSGKTTLGMQIAYFMDHTFNNDHIVFNGRQFEEAIERLPKGSCILWDEADDVGSNWASAMMISLKKTFKRIRKKNLIVLLVTPTYHDLNKYFAIHRTRFLIDVYTEFTTRGGFRLYNRNAKRLLYIYGKKEMNMNATKSSFFGKFSNYPKDFPIDMEAYEAAKDLATAETFANAPQPKDLRKEILIELIRFLHEKKVKYRKIDLFEIIGVSKSTFERYSKEIEGGV